MVEGLGFGVYGLWLNEFKILKFFALASPSYPSPTERDGAL